MLSCYYIIFTESAQRKLAHLTQGQKDDVPLHMYPERVVDTLASAITEDHKELEATLAGESQGEKEFQL